MRKLNRPADACGVEYGAVQVFDLCLDQIKRNVELRGRLDAIRARVTRMAKVYARAGETSCLYRLKPHDRVKAVSADELIALYENRLVDKECAGRSVYNRILASAVFGRCPLCDLGPACTLDHHLPKSRFPVFAVLPLNLVPSCQWCQFQKRTDHARTRGEQTLHPYFDDFSGKVWLKAEILPTSPACYSYYVDSPPEWGGVVAERLQKHFDSFKLVKLYGENAGSELTGIRRRLLRLAESGGAAAVRAHVQEEADSREESALNSWKSAMYRASAGSDWFCNGGFAEDFGAGRLGAKVGALA